MTELVTVFEISPGANGVLADTLFRLGIGVVGLIAGGYALAKLLRAKGRSAMAFIGPAFLIIWSTFWLTAHMSMAEIVLRTRDLIALQRSGKSEVTEGIVKVGHQQPRHGHSSGDKVSISGRQFEVNYFLVTPGYRETIAHGGVLRPGVYARVHHHDGVILKVEIRQSGKP